MGAALEVIDTFVTNPGAAITATTPFPGDTLSVRSINAPASAYLLDAWTRAGTAGIARIRSPRLHDNVQGIRFRSGVNSGRSLLPEEVRQRLYAQDVLTVEQSGGAAETDGVSLLVYYEDLPGAAARLLDWASVAPRVTNYVAVEVAVAAGAAVGARSPSAAINATFDLLVANTDYALLGYECDANGLSVGFRGIDTGNLRVGGPMTNEGLETRNWFVRQSNASGLPMIPIINSANKAGFLVDTAQVVAGVAANVTMVLAQLSQ